MYTGLLFFGRLVALFDGVSASITRSALNDDPFATVIAPGFCCTVTASAWGAGSGGSSATAGVAWWADLLWTADSSVFTNELAIGAVGNPAGATVTRLAAIGLSG